MAIEAHRAGQASMRAENERLREALYSWQKKLYDTVSPLREALHDMRNTYPAGPDCAAVTRWFHDRAAAALGATP
jgi:hypothetical protein